MYSDLPHVAVSRAPADSRINQIKAFRKATSMGLKESKDKIDHLAEEYTVEAYIYAPEVGAHSESDMWIVHDRLSREGFNAELRYSVPPEARDLDPLRGVAHSASVLAAVIAADAGDLATALSTASKLATVTQDSTLKATVIILGEALDRTNGHLKDSLLAAGYPGPQA